MKTFGAWLTLFCPTPVPAALWGATHWPVYHSSSALTPPLCQTPLLRPLAGAYQHFEQMLQNFKHTLLWHRLLVFPACLRLTPQSYYITMRSCQWASLLSLQLYCFFYVMSYSPVLFSLLALVFLAHQKVLTPKLSRLTSYRRHQETKQNRSSCRLVSATAGPEVSCKPSFLDPPCLIFWRTGLVSQTHKVFPMQSFLCSRLPEKVYLLIRLPVLWTPTTSFLLCYRPNISEVQAVCWQTCPSAPFCKNFFRLTALSVLYFK